MILIKCAQFAAIVSISVFSQKNIKLRHFSAWAPYEPMLNYPTSIFFREKTNMDVIAEISHTYSESFVVSHKTFSEKV